MEQESSFSRYKILGIIILCYLVPLIGISVYSALILRDFADWNILGLGFFLTSVGSLVFFYLMSQWEKSLNLSFNPLPVNEDLNSNSYSLKKNKPAIDAEEFDLTKRSLAEAQQTQIRLLSEIDILTEEIQKLSASKTEAFQQTEKLRTELEASKRVARQQLELQQNHIRELQEVVAHHKTMGEKKQQQVLLLETKVGSLTYEIKTLLQFAEAYNGPLLTSDLSELPSQEKAAVFEKTEIYSEPPLSPENHTQMVQEASQQLKHCLDFAQKIKGSQRFGSQIYSFLDSPADSFSLDLRRLCDRLRSESKSIILLYSPKDDHLLFASNQIKILTGWSPEKFVQNFFELLLEESQWKQGVANLALSSEVQIQLQLKTKSGTNLIANANLGMIPTGIFRNHVIAVLY